MTGEEAIKILNTVLLFSKCDCSKEECEECFKMAIKALEQEQYYKDLAESYEKTINKLTKAISEQEPKIVPITKIKFDEDKLKELVDKAVLTVTSQEPVIDKIRAEIEQEIIPRNSDQYDHEAMWQNCGLRIALKVIDKYKTESEKGGKDFEREKTK